jgi:hypothetical protein
MELDALEATLPPEDHTMMLPLRATADVFATAAKDVHAAAADPKLTPLGQREAVAKVIATAREALTPHQAEADRLAAIADATRAQALHPPATFTPDAAISREIRDRLTGKDVLDVRVAYYAAIGRGDWAFVHAVEQAPQAFALLDADSLEQGAQMRLGRSPLKAQLDAQALTARRHASVAATVKTELKRLAKAYGVDTEDA